MAEKVEKAFDLPVSPESVKTEDSARDDALSANRPSSPEPNCAICLSGFKNKSFTDTCVHQFCFTCLLEWSKVKAECPLCKQAFQCIIHNIRSLDDYDKYLVQSNPPAIPMPPSLPIPSTLEDFGLNYFMPNSSDIRVPFRYRTTMAPPHPHSDLHLFFEAFQMRSFSDHSNLQRSFEPGNFVLPTTRRQPSRRNALSGTSDFRRNIYRHNLWVRPQPDVTGRFRESSPEFYRLNEAATHRLAPWLNRELNVLVPNAEQQARVMELIFSSITLYPIRGSEFFRILSPYIGPHTRHFLHEFYSFAISQFDMVGYDLQVQYVSYAELGQDADVGSYDLSSDTDSDIQIVEVSTHQPRVEESNASNSAVQSVATVDDGNDSDCIVVEEVNPANRPIELIDVTLSDGESGAEGTIESLPNLGSTTVNVSSLSSEDDFYCIDEFPQVRNTTIPKLKVRDLREMKNPCLPSTSNEHPRSILKSRTRKSRVSSLSLETSPFSSDSDEEWKPVEESKVKRKKKKKKSKSCCCEKLKKHWKKERLCAYNSDSDTQMDSNSDRDSDYSDIIEHRRCHQKFVLENSRHKSSSNPRKRSKSKKSAKQQSSCDDLSDSPLFIDTDSTLSESSCHADENTLPQRQLRSKTSKSSATVVKKCTKSSKRKLTATTYKLKKSKSRKRVKTYCDYESTSPVSSEPFCKYEPTSPVNSSDSEKWYASSSRRRTMCLRSISTESEGVTVTKKSKSSTKKSQQVRNSVITALSSVTNNSDLEASGDSDRTVLITDPQSSLFVPKTEPCSALGINPDSDLESNNSSSGRPRLKSVVRVVNSSRRNSDSLPHYEIVSSSLCDPCPGPSTSKCPENLSMLPLKSILKKKA